MLDFVRFNSCVNRSNELYLRCCLALYIQTTGSRYEPHQVRGYDVLGRDDHRKEESGFLFDGIKTINRMVKATGLAFIG